MYGHPPLIDYLLAHCKNIWLLFGYNTHEWESSNMMFAIFLIDGSLQTSLTKLSTFSMMASGTQSPSPRVLPWGAARPHRALKALHSRPLAHAVDQRRWASRLARLHPRVD